MGLFSRERKGGKVIWGISFQWQKQQQQELVGTKAEARRLLTQRRKEVAEGTYSPEHKTGEVTARQWAKTWGSRRTNKTASDDRTRLEKHFTPHLGDMKLADIRPRHIIAWIRTLRTLGHPGPKSIHNVYGNVCTMFRDAVIDELIPATPCVIPDGTLPPKPDKQPGIYEKPAIVLLLTDTRIPLDRRTFYWLAFFTGMRHGELAGRRWRHLDYAAEPLAAIDVSTQYYDEPLKSPDGKLRPRKVPMHPLLRQALEHWHDVGFPKHFGRKPQPGDFIVPSRRGGKAEFCRTVRRSLSNLVERDCPTVGVEPLTFHRTRDTFTSLCRRAGAPKDVVERITHNAKGEMIDTYTHLDWTPLCAAVLVVELPLPPGPALSLPAPEGPHSSMSQSMSPSEGEEILAGELLESGRGGRDSNTSAPRRNQGNRREKRGSKPPKTGAKSPEEPADAAEYVTGHGSEATAFDAALREHLGALPPAEPTDRISVPVADEEVSDAG